MFRVNYWIHKGAPRSKLVVGIPTYGRSWTLSSSLKSPGSPASGGGTAGVITQASGMLGYNEICLLVKNNGWSVIQDRTRKMGPYAVKGNQWVGYDDPAIVSLKAKYIIDNELGGAMFWDLSTDDFGNHCGEGKYPIVTAVKRVLGSSNFSGNKIHYQIN